jgi:hypothetical protein
MSPRTREHNGDYGDCICTYNGRHEARTRVHNDGRDNPNSVSRPSTYFNSGATDPMFSKHAIFFYNMPGLMMGVSVGWSICGTDIHMPGPGVCGISGHWGIRSVASLVCELWNDIQVSLSKY